MDDIDRNIVNLLQGGFPISELPYRQAAESLGLTEDQLIERIGRMLDEGALTRFGPLYHAERLGGAYALAAMKVPAQDVERVALAVNRLPEVAHNYEREHAFNLWFVLATETPRGIAGAAQRLERDTGYPVYLMPKLDEYFVGLRFAV
ncbi:MAG: protein nirG [Betaproteobacteria bacterium RIFCSPLOWO2_12_FULL_62_58]|nr:MAG: protein nirG [Betaproteobacteria bacterium RIFCSPLOWO2_12_FULL_62_58]